MAATRTEITDTVMMDELLLQAPDLEESLYNPYSEAGEQIPLTPLLDLGKFKCSKVLS